MNRAVQINEKITLERLKKTLKDPVTWKALLGLLGLRMLLTAYKKASVTPVVSTNTTVPRDSINRFQQVLRGSSVIGKATPAEMAQWAKNKPSESELLREFTKIIQDEMRKKGLLPNE